MNWRGRIAGMVEIVTDIVMSATGVVTSNGMDEDDKIESVAGWHFGFYSRPKDGARGVVLKADGQGNTSFLVAWRDKQYELTLEKGEVGIKNAFDAEILLDENGDILLTSKSGQKVKLNGADYSLLKTEDLLTDLETWVTAANTVLGGNCVNGATITTYAAQSAALIAFATALNVAGAYKSTKVSNG